MERPGYLPRELRASHAGYIRFHCYTCGASFEILLGDDPTSSSGACKCCGSYQWTMRDEEGKPVS